MSVTANKAPNGMIYLEIMIEPPRPEDVDEDGKAALSNYFTQEQWNKLLELDGTNVFGDL